MLILLGQTPPDTTAPVVSATPDSGTYAVGQPIVLTASEPATTYYTLSGSAPTVNSPVYSGPISLNGVVTLQAFAVDAAGNVGPIITKTYQSSIVPLTEPPDSRQIATATPAPGVSGEWQTSSPPLAPTPAALPPIYGLTEYVVTLDGQDITALASALTITEAESAVFGTCSFDLPVGIAVDQGVPVVVTIAGSARNYILEDIGAEGPKRSLWCRSAACVLDDPHSAEISLNGWDNPHTTAAALAASIASSVPLVWGLQDWALPPSWELSGTPIECLQQLVQSCDGILQSLPDGSLIARRRWPVRPVSMASETAVVTISRDTAISLSAKEKVGKGWGSIVVYGYDPSADLPEMEVEETTPQYGSPVHVRLYWHTPSPPPFASFLTNGSAAYLDSGSLLITAEEVTFDKGVGSTKYPIATLHSFDWMGNDQGNIFWLTTGDSRELSMTDSTGRGIARITYTTTYERWRLTGQTAPKVIFGIDVGQGQVSAKVSYNSGGSIAPAVTAPMLYDTSICVAAGTSYLDDARAKQVISAELPLTTAPILPGTTILVDDAVTAASGKGKATSCTTSLTPTKTTVKYEVEICH